jgi:predicted nucleic acid-binding Zn ribbon protein
MMGYQARRERQERPYVILIILLSYINSFHIISGQCSEFQNAWRKQTNLIKLIFYYQFIMFLLVENIVPAITDNFIIFVTNV